MSSDIRFEGKFQLDTLLTIPQYNALKKYAAMRHDNSNEPGYFCQWVPTEDGLGITWDGQKSFYNAKEWLECIVDYFLKPWGIKVSGEVLYQGEEVDDRGSIIARDNVITKEKYTRNPVVRYCPVCDYSQDMRDPHIHMSF